MTSPESALNQAPLVKIDGLKKYFPVQKGFLDQVLSGHIDYIRAVDDVSFEIQRGEVFGLAGESDSGKSTIGKLAIGLLQPTAGSVLFDGINLSTIQAEKLRQLRSWMQVIFQDPMASLNPRMTIGDSVSHGLRIHFPKPVDYRELTLQILDRVGLTPPRYFYNNIRIKFPVDKDNEWSLQEL